jgi:uncharacterized delta-60 repeat protein
MTLSSKISGVYKDNAPYVNVGGTWKFSKEAWSNVSGVWKQFFLASGINDSSFNTVDNVSGFDNTVYSIAIQSDGKIILVGDFFTFNAITVNRIVRLNADGTIDTAFTTNNGTGASSRVNSVAIQSDGKIILVGSFITFNGATVNRIVRLNADGTRDTAFTTNTGTGVTGGVVNSIAIQSDGKIIVVGFFFTFNGATVSNIVRLNADGTRDTALTTNTGSGSDNIVNSLAIQSDGKIILVGSFTRFNGATVNRIVRLNSNGTRDTAFTTSAGTGASSTVNSIAIQSDGKIILGGGFSSFNGATVNRIVRLNSNGTRDTAFTTSAGTGANSTVNSIAIQSDGNIILVGSFTTFNGATVNRIVRLNADGTIDTAFTTNTGTGANSTVNSIAIQSDGKIILGGFFFTFNGATVNYIVRLNADGSLNNFYTINGVSSIVNSLAIQSDGKIILVGSFTIFNGATVNYIVRLNADGTIDTAFTTNTGTGVGSGASSVAIQSDGKIILGGYFQTFNGATVNSIVRLNADGTRDTAFTTNTGTGFDSTVSSIAIQSDGKIILGGYFQTFNGATVYNIVRLNADGTRDTAFITNTGTGANTTVNSIAIQSDGKIILGGGFSSFNGATVNRIVRLNADGTRDTAFTTSAGTGANSTVNSIAIQSDGKIILGGFFFTFNGATVNYIVRLNADGTIDTAFTTNTGTGASGPDINKRVGSIAIQSDGKIILGGFFTIFNGATVNSIVRLNADGTRDTAFTTNTGTGVIGGAVNSIAIQSDGKIIVVGGFKGFNQVVRNNILRIGGDLSS